MPRDLTPILWLLKLGTLANAFFIARVLALEPCALDPRVAIPALTLFVVSGYRCAFPNRYEDNVVLHDSVLSSTFVTRTLATFSEVSFIYLLSLVVRTLNVDRLVWVDLLAWLMVVQVGVSQLFVWAAILTGRLSLYFWEEVGWGVIFVANTIASAWLHSTTEPPGPGALLLQLNLLFGLVYLPWQVLHVRSLHADAKSGDAVGSTISMALLMHGLRASISNRTRATDPESWGGLIGLTWMTAYWATLIPIWVDTIVQATASR
jgi:hypothetical protein